MKEELFKYKTNVFLHSTSLTDLTFIHIVVILLICRIPLSF
jgi:hypothetical protein